MITSAELEKLAANYAKAWSSRNPKAVGAFFTQDALISVNDSATKPIAEFAAAFMRDFPDMIVTFDKLETRPDGVAFHWTLIGTNTGPGGSGQCVRISGYELWQINNRGLIEKSEGHFDAAEYARQLGERVED